MQILSVCFAWLLLVTAMSAEPPRKNGPAVRIDLSAYTMTFQDEFNGTSLDTTKWEAPEMPRQGGSRWKAEQVSVKDGNLRLGIKLTDDPVLRYDCGAVRTQRNYDRNQSMFIQKYGYFEARCKLPKRIDADYFADFWIMAGRVGEGNNSRDGQEIDIFESFELAEGHQYSMNFHWSGYGWQHNAYGLKCGQQPQLRDNQFHVYGLLWTEEFYAAYVDGIEIGRTDMMGLGSDKDGKLLSNGPCREAGYLKLTVEAAQWPGKASGWEADAPTEDEFLIDWVRCYLPKTDPEAAAKAIVPIASSVTPVVAPAAPVVVVPPKPKMELIAAGLSDFDNRLYKRIQTLVAEGKGPQFHKNVINSQARIEQADADGGLVLRIKDSVLTWEWKRLDLNERCALALACARPNDNADAAESAFWLFATGQSEEAERQLAFADAAGAAAVRAAFTVKIVATPVPVTPVAPVAPLAP
jgi:beta-glucanase (GH16 family)